MRFVFKIQEAVWNLLDRVYVLWRRDPWELPWSREYRKLGKNLDELLSHRGRLPPRELLAALEYRLTRKAYPDRYECLPLAAQRLIAMHRLRVVISGAGFDTYFRNVGGDSLKLALEGFEEAGAFRMSATLGRVLELFPNKLPSPHYPQRALELDLLAKDTQSFWREYENAFRAAEEGLDLLMLSYVMNNRAGCDFKARW